jgi:Leucine-rich repeat (LRR) protein
MSRFLQLDEADLENPDLSNVDHLQTGRAPKKAMVPAIARLVAQRPDLWLKIYSESDKPVNLSFLSQMKGLKLLELDLPPDSLADLDGIAHLPDSIEELYLPYNRKVTRSLHVLEKFTQLRTLAISGKISNLEGLQCCANLQRLLLFKAKLKSLAPLAKMPALKRLDLDDTRIESYASLGEMQQLTRLRMAWPKGVDSLDSLTRLTRLKTLIIFGLKNALPDLSPMTKLDAVRLITEVNNLPQVFSAGRLRVLDYAGDHPFDAAQFARLPRLRSLVAASISFEGDRQTYLPLLEQRLNLKIDHPWLCHSNPELVKMSWYEL